MISFRRLSAAMLAVAALSAVAAPAASANPVDQAVCYVKTGDGFKCFQWGP